MRAHTMLTALICGLLMVLLAACSSGLPLSTPTSVLATPPPVASDPTPESMSTPQSTTEEMLAPTETAESTPTLAAPTARATPAVRATPAPVPDGPLIIVALGDSLTEGDGDQPGDGGGYPARLQRSINEVRPNSQVINLGKSGWDSQQMVEGQLPSALQANPNVALVWIGSNDLWYNNGPDQETADLDRYTDNIDTALRALTGAGAKIYIALLDDQSQRPYATSPEGAGLSPEGVAYMSSLASAFNDAVRAKAAEYGATTVDFYNTTIFTDPATLADDGNHPNATGYDLIEQIWFEAIRKDLR